MKKESVQISPEEQFQCAAFVSILEAYAEGEDMEYQPMRKKLMDEGFEHFLTFCLMEYSSSEFDRLCIILRDLKLILERESARTDIPDPRRSSSARTDRISAHDELRQLFSGARNEGNFENHKDDMRAAFAKIRKRAREEGREMRREDIARRMHRLGFPLHTILRLTGFDPVASEKQKASNSKTNG